MRYAVFAAALVGMAAVWIYAFVAFVRRPPAVSRPTPSQVELVRQAAERAAQEVAQTIRYEAFSAVRESLRELVRLESESRTSTGVAGRGGDFAFTYGTNRLDAPSTSPDFATLVQRLRYAEFSALEHQWELTTEPVIQKVEPMVTTDLPTTAIAGLGKVIGWPNLRTDLPDDSLTAPDLTPAAARHRHAARRPVTTPPSSSSQTRPTR
jgi:hypothetical protein